MAGFEPAVPERKQTHAFDRDATGDRGSSYNFPSVILKKNELKKHFSAWIKNSVISKQILKRKFYKQQELKNQTRSTNFI